jgi:hypothetical protein
MANPEHLKILKQGVGAWNKWREKNPRITPNLRRADLRQALPRAYLRQANLYGANLAEAQAGGANLQRADLSGAQLSATDLQAAELRWANLRGADLGGANLTEVKLSRADLTKANLNGANLCRANLSRAQLFRADLTGALLDDSDFTHARAGGTVFADNNLSTIKGLHSVWHFGPSTIGIDTIYGSKGNIPEAFLRGVGVPQDFIVYMRSLVSKAIDFYSCFISYSSKDDDFAQRLHADLQPKGVRCWFAPKDLKIGDKFRARFEESIRIYDKAMVILSVNSIRSPWVEEEVEAALEKERKQNKLVLFPIRLDDAVMETDQAWAASLRRARHIGDFRAWKDHDQYQKSFERLLRDLKA